MMNLIKRITDKLRRKPLLVKPAVMPSPIWVKGEFELYHKHGIYYVLWCKSHLIAYDITIEPDEHSYIKIKYVPWFEHPWEELNIIIKQHHCQISKD